MSELAFRKATKEQSKLRLALFGPSGSGKTFTSLRLAAGMGGHIAVIDTEHGSASKYADRFEFDVLELPSTTVETYVAAIKAASKNGYSVLIVDSLTHGWYELLDEVNRIARARFGGNTWSAWSEGTPKQRSLVNAILEYPGHVIATMRTKTEWTVTTDEKGRTKPVRLGLAPEQGKGIEYEFDLLGELSPEHALTFTKDRSGQYQDQTIELPGEELGQELAAWLSQGEPPKPRVTPKKADVLPEPPPPQPELLKTNGHTYDSPQARAEAMRVALNERLGNERYKHAAHLLNALQLEFGDQEWNWPDLTDDMAWKAAYQIALAHAGKEAE